MQWDDSYKTDKLVWGEQPNELAVLAVRYLNEFGSPDRALEMLDLGCGYGRDVVFLARNVSCNVLGIDSSQEAITLARRRLGQAESRVSFQCCDFRQMADSQFDVIFASNLYQVLNIGDRKAFMEVVGRALKDGGVLFMNVLSTNDPQQFGKGEPVPDDESSFQDDKFLHFCTRQELERDFAFLTIEKLYEHEYYEPHSGGETHHHISWLLVGIKR